MIVKSSKLSDFKIKKLIWCFCVDVEASKVSTEVIVHTDKWRGYDGLVDVGYDKHKRINHSKAFSYGNGTHINGIENFWSFTKGRLAKFRGVKVNFVIT